MLLWLCAMPVLPFLAFPDLKGPPVGYKTSKSQIVRVAECDERFHSGTRRPPGIGVVTNPVPMTLPSSWAYISANHGTVALGRGSEDCADWALHFAPPPRPRKVLGLSLKGPRWPFEASLQKDAAQCRVLVKKHALQFRKRRTSVVGGLLPALFVQPRDGQPELELKSLLGVEVAPAVAAQDLQLAVDCLDLVGGREGPTRELGILQER